MNEVTLFLLLGLKRLSDKPKEIGLQHKHVCLKACSKYQYRNKTVYGLLLNTTIGNILSSGNLACIAGTKWLRSAVSSHFQLVIIILMTIAFVLNMLITISLLCFILHRNQMWWLACTDRNCNIFYSSQGNDVISSYNYTPVTNINISV